jgi:hypothetical protein
LEGPKDEDELRAAARRIEKELVDVCACMAHYQCGLIVGLQRAHIVLPQELIEEIDAVVGPRGRSAFLVETARAELRRRRLLTFLQNDQPAWNEKDHPELAAGAEAWVRRVRSESEIRIPTKRQTKPKRRTK